MFKYQMKKILIKIFSNNNELLTKRHLYFPYSDSIMILKIYTFEANYFWIHQDCISQ